MRETASAWPLARLDECCEVVAGATPDTTVDAYWGGDICWATPKDLSELSGRYIEDTPRKLTQAGLDSCAATILPAGSVLFSSRAPIGHVAINTIPMATNQGFKSLIPAHDRVNNKYLYWWLRTNRRFLETLGNGATFKEVSKAVVSGIRIPVPPLNEQNRIAGLLDRADELRAKRRAALAQLDALTQAIFLDLFGDPATNPKQWPTPTAIEVCRRITVGIVVQPASHYRSVGIPALRSLNVRANNISTENLVFFSPEDNETKLTKTRIWNGDVVLVRSGQPGTAAVVPAALDGANAIDLLIVTPEKSRIVPLYLSYYFNSSGGKRMALGEQRGQVQKHLNVSSLKDAPIPLPPMSVQQEFARRVAAVEKLKATHRVSLAELDALFASLQHRAFRGEL